MILGLRKTIPDGDLPRKGVSPDLDYFPRPCQRKMVSACNILELQYQTLSFKDQSRQIGTSV